MAADTMSPSPEIKSETRKRPLDDHLDLDTNDNCELKRPHFSPGAEDALVSAGAYYFKILVPSVAAGAIIGKGGETIAQLQKKTGAKIKMSKSHDFYPGTTERICLICGGAEAIMTVLDFIMDKIKEKPEVKALGAEADSKTPEREKQVKILVPNSTAGMIIGKAGNYIKQIKEETGSYVQISQKAKEVSLQERCITVIGEKDSNKSACMMILSKVVDDPQSGSCLNVSYADYDGPVANYNPTGSPYASTPASAAAAAVAAAAAAQQSQFGSTSTLNSCASGAAASNNAAAMILNGAAAAQAAAGRLTSLSLNLGAPTVQNVNPASTAQLLEHIKVALRSSGFSDASAAEVIAALSVLAKYGILGMSLGAAAASSPTMAQMPQLSGATAYLGVMDNAVAANSPFGAIGQVGLENWPAYLHLHDAMPASMNPYLAAAAAAAAAAGSQSAAPTSRAATAVERYAATAADNNAAAAAAIAAAFDPFRHHAAAVGATGATPVTSCAAQTAPVVTMNSQNSYTMQGHTVNNANDVATNVSMACSNGATTVTSVGGNNARSPTPGVDMTTKSVEIPEGIVGAILGPGGRCLVEIQQISCATIQISKKGSYAPNTRNRIVTISGSAGAIKNAQRLIEQRIQDEETKRARQQQQQTVAQVAASAAHAATAAQVAAAVHHAAAASLF